MKSYRQGDVLLQQIREIPVGVKRVQPRNGRLVLAEGEATGHAHSIAASYGALFLNGNLDMFLRAAENCRLQHEEHGPIAVDSGNYRVVIQREYSPLEIRNVVD